MTDAEESQIYRELMRFRPDTLTANAWAVKAGVSRTVWADMRRHGNPSRRTLEKLLRAAGSSLAEFEALRVGDQGVRQVSSARSVGDATGSAWIPAGIPALPLVSSSLAGEWRCDDQEIEITEIRPQELLERLPRPAALMADPDAYALTIVGDAMWPRFRPGRRIAVTPRSPVAIGDDVLVRLRQEDGDSGSAGGRLVLIKELVKRTHEFLELRQFNPDLSVRVGTERVDTIHKIAGELI